MTFANDLRRGDHSQAKVIELLAESGFCSTPVDPKSSDRAFWDITSTGHSLEFATEIKFDEYESRSDNIAIEVSNPRLGKPSGIRITKAFFWVQALVDSIWITATERLRIFIEENDPKRIIQTGGDGNAELYLYENTVILPAIFTRIDNIPPRQLLDYIKEQQPCKTN